MTEELQTEQIEDETVYKAEQKRMMERNFSGRLRDVVANGAQSRLVIHNKRNGQQMADVPLAAGLAIAGGLAVMSPFWAVVGGVVAIVAPVSFEITQAEEVDHA